jgi:hypothetical protein
MHQLLVLFQTLSKPLQQSSPPNNPLMSTTFVFSPEKQAPAILAYTSTMGGFTLENSFPHLPLNQPDSPDSTPRHFLSKSTLAPLFGALG